MSWTNIAPIQYSLNRQRKVPMNQQLGIKRCRYRQPLTNMRYSIVALAASSVFGRYLLQCSGDLPNITAKVCLIVRGHTDARGCLLNTADDCEAAAVLCRSLRGTGTCQIE